MPVDFTSFDVEKSNVSMFIKVLILKIIYNEKYIILQYIMKN